MKNLYKFTLAVALIFIGGSALAQETDNTTLTINLDNVYEIEVNSEQTSVAFDMNTPAHFSEGNGIDLTEHLTINATGKFVVTLSASGENFRAVNGSGGQISVSNVRAEFSGGMAYIQHAADTYLSTEAKTVLTGEQAVMGRGLNVRYEVPKATAENFLNQPKDKYRTRLTYTISAP